MDFSRQQTLPDDISKNRSSLTGNTVGKTGVLTGTLPVQQIGFEAEVPGKVVYHTGPKGDKGDPGKDGYTPVKGVDYFDGKDGEKGEKGDPGQSIKGDPGEDGYSPTAKVEQTDTGARITITDKSGTTTAEVLHGDGGQGSAGAVLYVKQTLTEEQQTQARTNINAVSMEEVEELLGIEEEFSETGNPLVLNLDEEKEIEVISKISRQESSPYYESTKLTLHWANSEAIIDTVSMYGGSGTVIEKNGLTMTVNDDGTATFKGTSTASTLFDATIPKPKVIYPAGSYLVPSSGMMMQLLDLNGGGLGNKWGRNKFTIDQSFVLNRVRLEYKTDQTVDETKPISISLANIESDSGNSYAQTEYTVDFGKVVTEGEYNWTTGELKDADGNTVSYHGGQQIIGTAGMNVFWTGFGEVTASNKTNNLEKVVIRLGEAAPDETVSSICDFTLTPTTPQAGYCLHGTKVIPSGTAEFLGQEIPLITTKGTLAVVDAHGNVMTEKYVDALINWQGATDLLTNKGIHKEWSDKFYFAKEPVAREDFSYSSGVANALYTFEFAEEDFQNTGLPAKLDNIPIVSPCFYTGADAASKLNARVWGGHIFPATFSWDSTSGKYIFKVRGLYKGIIMAQLTDYSKGYFHYQLETPYDVATTVALGISSGDTVTFAVDDSDWKTYLDGGLYIDSSATAITTADATPTGFVYIPRNAEDACNGMLNAARMLNNAESAGGDATVQGYSWIGEGDGSTDYTSKIQTKLDVLHSVSDGGTVYLGPGTYPISGSLIVYDNTRIIGDGQTVIEQTADNTHAIVWSGSNIVMRDLTIKLSGACTELTACIFANSNNVANGNRDELYPENTYVWNCSVSNVALIGKYKLTWEGNYQYLSEDALAYRGVGVYSKYLFFNFFDCNGLFCEYLYAGVYHGGGSNNYRLYATHCRFAAYTNQGGNNRYEIKGHTYYGYNSEGTFSATDYVVYSEGEADIYDIGGFYDTQHTKACIYFAPLSMSNICYLRAPMSELSNTLSATHVGHTDFVDYGRCNEIVRPRKKTYFAVGNRQTDITGQSNSNVNLSPTVDNALAGAGVWGNISSNVQWTENGIKLADVCRYPKDNNYSGVQLASIVSSVSPSKESPVEIALDISDRPIYGYYGLWIQFDHRYVAQDMTISFDTKNDGTYSYTWDISNNVEPVTYYLGNQKSTVKIYRIKISITKALVIPELLYRDAGYGQYTIDYNPDGLVGIVNIGMPQNEAYGRAFLGECGGSLYGNVDMHQNTLKNLPDPVDAGDAVSKSYLEARLAALEALINGM